MHVLVCQGFFFTYEISTDEIIDMKGIRNGGALFQVGGVEGGGDNAGKQGCPQTFLESKDSKI